MNRNVHFLNAIYEDANQTSQSIDTLLHQTESHSITGEMQRQMSQYRAISHQAKTLIGNYNAPPPPQKPLVDFTTQAGKHLAAALDNSETHIAQLLIKEGTQGVANMTRTVKEFCCCDKSVEDLGNHLLDVRQKNIDELKKYL